MCIYILCVGVYNMGVLIRIFQPFHHPLGTEMMCSSDCPALLHLCQSHFDAFFHPQFCLFVPYFIHTVKNRCTSIYWPRGAPLRALLCTFWQDCCTL